MHYGEHLLSNENKDQKLYYLTRQKGMIYPCKTDVSFIICVATGSINYY
jgi:hypothetical protein